MCELFLIGAVIMAFVTAYRCKGNRDRNDAEFDTPGLYSTTMRRNLGNDFDNSDDGGDDGGD